MIYNTKNIILMNPKKYKDTIISKFFQDLGIEIQYQYDPSVPYMFIVDDFFVEDDVTPRLKLDPNISINTKARFDIDLINNPVIQKILHFKFANTSGNDLLDEYSSEEKVAYTLKIQDYLNSGFLVDRIVNHAYEKKIDFQSLRNYLNKILEVFGSKVTVNDSSSLFDITATYSEGVFLIKIVFGLNFQGIASLNQSSIQELSIFSNYTNVDIYSLRDKMIITAGWFSDNLLKNYKACFLEDLGTMQTFEQVNHQRTSGLNIQDATYDGINSKAIEVDKLSLAKKITFYLKKVLEYEETVSPESLMIHEIDPLLTKYPNQKILKNIDDEVRGLILKLLKESNLERGLDEFVQKVSSSSINKQLTEVKRIIKDKNLKDLEEFILVKGSNSIDTTINRISGWYESAENHLSANEKWEIKKNHIISLIDQEIGKQQLFGNPIVGDDLVRIISSQINAPIDDVKILVNDILSEAVSVTIFGEESVNICIELLQAKQVELDKVIVENEKLKSLAIKSMNAYKELLNQKKTNIDNLDLMYLAEIKQLKIKMEVTEQRIKGQSTLIEKMESSLKVKEVENNILKARLLAKEKERDELFKGTMTGSDEKYIQRLKIEKKTAEDAQIALQNDIKRQEKQLTLINAQYDDLRKRKSDTENELAEKKKDALKLKNENSLLLHKIAELERKILIYERKIA